MITNECRIAGARVAHDLSHGARGQQVLHRLAEAALPDRNPLAGKYIEGTAARLLKHGLRFTARGLPIAARIGNALAGGVSVVVASAAVGGSVSHSLATAAFCAGLAAAIGPHPITGLFTGMTEGAVLQAWIRNPKDEQRVFHEFFKNRIGTDAADYEVVGYIRPRLHDLILNGTDDEARATIRFMDEHDFNALMVLFHDLSQTEQPTHIQVRTEMIAEYLATSRTAETIREIIPLDPGSIEKEIFPPYLHQPIFAWLTPLTALHTKVRMAINTQVFNQHRLLSPAKTVELIRALGSMSENLAFEELKSAMGRIVENPKLISLDWPMRLFKLMAAFGPRGGKLLSWHIEPIPYADDSIRQDSQHWNKLRQDMLTVLVEDWSVASGGEEVVQLRKLIQPAKHSPLPTEPLIRLNTLDATNVYLSHGGDLFLAHLSPDLEKKQRIVDGTKFHVLQIAPTNVIAIRGLIDGLKSDNAGFAAIELLPFIKQDDVRTALEVYLLGDTGAESVRMQIAWKLANLTHPDSLETFETILEQARDAHIDFLSPIHRIRTSNSYQVTYGVSEKSVVMAAVLYATLQEKTPAVLTDYVLSMATKPHAPDTVDTSHLSLLLRTVADTHDTIQAVLNYYTSLLTDFDRSPFDRKLDLLVRLIWVGEQMPEQTIGFDLFASQVMPALLAHLTPKAGTLEQRLAIFLTIASQLQDFTSKEQLIVFGQAFLPEMEINDAAFDGSDPDNVKLLMKLKRQETP
jgi:hypothetical protein